MRGWLLLIAAVATCSSIVGVAPAGASRTSQREWAADALAAVAAAPRPLAMCRELVAAREHDRLWRNQGFADLELDLRMTHERDLARVARPHLPVDDRRHHTALRANLAFTQRLSPE